MRISAAVILTTGFLIVGCGDNNPPAKLDGGQADLSMTTPLDMAVVKTGCAVRKQCTIDCFNNATTSQEYIDCSDECEANTKTQGNNLFDNMITCVYAGYCVGAADMDMGAARVCRVEGTGASAKLIDVGTGTEITDDPNEMLDTECEKCLEDSYRAAVGFTALGAPIGPTPYYAGANAYCANPINACSNNN